MIRSITVINLINLIGIISRGHPILLYRNLYTRFGYKIHKIEEEKLLKKQKQRAEQILWKTRHLFPNKAILYTCCLELLYKELYKENIDIKSTGFQSVSDLMHNSIIWKSLGNDRFVVVRNDDQKCDSLLLKKEEIA